MVTKQLAGVWLPFHETEEKSYIVLAIGVVSGTVRTIHGISRGQPKHGRANAWFAKIISAMAAVENIQQQSVRAVEFALAIVDI